MLAWFGISQNCNGNFFFTLTDDMTHLSMGAGSIGYDVKCAKRAPVVLQTMYIYIHCLHLAIMTVSAVVIMGINLPKLRMCFLEWLNARGENTFSSHNTHMVFSQLYFYQYFRNVAQSTTNSNLWRKSKIKNIKRKIKIFLGWHTSAAVKFFPLLTKTPTHLGCNYTLTRLSE